MARRPLKAGAAGSGKISIRALPSGRFAARARYRDLDGVVRPVEAQAADKAAAEEALVAKLNARSGPPVKKVKSTSGPGGEQLSTESDTQITRIGANTTIRDAVNLWLHEVSQDTDRKIQTRDFWRQVARQTVLKAGNDPKIADLTVAEFDAGVIRRYLQKLNRTTPGQAGKARLLINAVLRDAVIDGAIPHNPVLELKRPKKKKRPPTRALSVEEFRLLMASVETWRTAAAAAGGAPRDPSFLLVDLLWVLAGTGLRVNEALGLRTADIDFTSTPPSFTLHGTLVQVTGKPTEWQPSTKGTAGDERTMTLPSYAVRALERQIQLNGHHEFVFITGTGGFVSNRNVTRSLRQARPSSLSFFTPHTLRRSVATWVKAATSLAAASAQLGHGTEDVTSQYYIQPEERESVDNAAALDDLLDP